MFSELSSDSQKAANKSVLYCVECFATRSFEIGLFAAFI